MPDLATEATDKIPSLSAAWESARQEAESQGETSPPPEPDVTEPGEADEAQPDAAAGEQEGQTEAEDQAAGDAEAEEPNPEGEEPEAEAPADFDPVLKTLAPEAQEGLRAMSPEARKALAKRLRSADTAVQDANKRAAADAKDAEAFRKLAPPDKKALRERIWKMLAEDGAAKPEAVTPQAAKRPRVEEFDTAEDYEAAMDKWEAEREERILSRVESKVQTTLTAEQTAVRNIESKLREWRTTQGDALTDDEFVAASKVIGRALAQERQDDPDWHKSYRPEEAIRAVRAVILAARGVTPKASGPARQPNPGPRRVQAASVPTTRGMSPKPVNVPRYVKEGREPTLAEAWSEAEEEVAQGTRPTARNGAVR